MPRADQGSGWVRFPAWDRNLACCGDGGHGIPSISLFREHAPDDDPRSTSKLQRKTVALCDLHDAKFVQEQLVDDGTALGYSWNSRLAMDSFDTKPVHKGMGNRLVWCPGRMTQYWMTNASSGHAGHGWGCMILTSGCCRGLPSGRRCNAVLEPLGNIGVIAPDRSSSKLDSRGTMLCENRWRT